MTEEDPIADALIKELESQATNIDRAKQDYWAKWKEIRSRVDSDYVLNKYNLKRQAKLSELHYELTQGSPQAQYENLDFVHSDDPVVCEFMEKLGFNPATIKRATIIIEPGKPLEVKADILPLSGSAPES